MNILSPTSQDVAEAAVLGAVLLTPAALDVVLSERIRPEHFRRIQHRAVCHAILAMHDQGQAVDEVTLKARFSGPQSPVTSADIEMLAASVHDLGNLRSYCRIVRENAWFDRASEAIFTAGQALQERDRTAVLGALTGLDETAGAEDEPDPRAEFMAWYDSDRSTWPLPFSELTDCTGGLVPGEPTVLGGWSGMGKTFLLAQMLRHCAKAGARVHEYANEMQGPKRTARTLASMTGIPTGLIDRKKLDGDQTREIMAALRSLPYMTTPTPGWSVETYCRDLRRNKWDVAAIDTVTNLPCSRVDEWDRACVMLADAAAQAGTHLILVSQLNLERDKGKKPPPVGRDLRNTGAWYQRARVVMFVHRDQERIDTGEDAAAIWRAKPDGHVRVEKATHGTEGIVAVRFNPKWLRFDEVASRHLEAVA